MRVDFAKLDALHRQLTIVRKLTAIALHLIDDRILSHMALTILEPEIQRLCALANRLILDLRRPELAPAAAIADPPVDPAA